MQSAGKIIVFSPDDAEGNFLGDLLQVCKGNICHFGGCSWAKKQDFTEKNIVKFADPMIEKKYQNPELSEDDKRSKRRARFGM